MFNQPDLSEHEKTYFLEEIRNQLGATMTLLDNLLQWSMLQFKGDNLSKKAQIHVHSEVQQLLVLLNSQAKRKNIHIKTTIDPHFLVYVDPNHFQLIIRNLIGNALKFSHPNQEILVQAEMLKNHFYLHVTDHGVGMSKEVVDSLFSKSTFHTTFGTGGEKGAGLGLNLCYEYALLNNGELMVSSQLGKGSTFIYLALTG